MLAVAPIVMGSIPSDDSDDELDWANQLQANRLVIAKQVDYNKLAPALQSSLIFDREDDESIKNPYQNPTSATRASRFLSIYFSSLVTFSLT